jgi:sigma-B regulation protein RsbU (phosphoserine phosphatase)
MATGPASASEPEKQKAAEQGKGNPQPSMVFVDGPEWRRFRLSKVPFAIGRRVDKDLVLTDTRCSRDHAVITREDDGYYVIDGGSKLGTYVNGAKIERQKLKAQDRVEFGVRAGAYLIFDAEPADAGEAGMLLSRMSGWMPMQGGNELSALNVLLEAARKLNRSSVLEEVLVTLLDTSLRLTRAERGFVFLRDEDGAYRMAAARNARGETMTDDATISHSTLQEAAESGCEFVVTEADGADKLVGRRSVEDYGLSSVICIPLRKTSLADGQGSMAQAKKSGRGNVLGVTYLDSRSLAGRLSGVTHDVLRAIATDAAKLVENASLVQAQEAARRYEQELAIAATIQQRLLSVRIPDVPYAEVRARSVACQQVGGDFFDVVRTQDAIAVVVGDVSGKGVSAALLASVLQGLIYSLLGKGVPLAEIAEVVHGFLCEKEIGEKYATLLLARVSRAGELEFVNCGHLPPALVLGGKVEAPEESSPPVGLVREITFQVARRQMKPGDRVLVVTDGVTEAENAAGKYFGMENFYDMAASRGLAEIVDAVTEFSAGVAPSDDCTGLELIYRG